MKKLFNYFTLGEKLLWLLSCIAVALSFFLFGRNDLMYLAASLIGVTSLIFNAKGNPVGQFLMVVFSIFYGIISFRYSYYGEIITYVGMTLPMAVAALAAWLRHPFKGNRSEVEVNRIGAGEYVFASFLTVCVTIGFNFILKAFGTANLIPSTLSVTTSFAAVYLTFRRSPYYAVCYAANDIVLIVLWTLASFDDTSYISVVVCFAAFLANDIYGFISWKRMEKKQMQ